MCAQYHGAFWLLFLILMSVMESGLASRTIPMDRHRFSFPRPNRFEVSTHIKNKDYIVVKNIWKIYPAASSCKFLSNCFRCRYHICIMHRSHDRECVSYHHKLWKMSNISSWRIFQLPIISYLSAQLFFSSLFLICTQARQVLKTPAC